MKIVQYRDGSGRILFSVGEIRILKKKKYIEFPAEGMKHIANSLMRIAVGINDKIPEDKKDLVTQQNEHIPATIDEK